MQAIDSTISNVSLQLQHTRNLTENKAWWLKTLSFVNEYIIDGKLHSDYGRTGLISVQNQHISSIQVTRLKRHFDYVLKALLAQSHW